MTHCWASRLLTLVGLDDSADPGVAVGIGRAGQGVYRAATIRALGRIVRLLFPSQLGGSVEQLFDIVVHPDAAPQRIYRPHQAR
jgi:hypothetical protein